MILNFINRQIRQVKENGIKEVFRKFIVLSRLILSIPFYLFGLFFGFLIIIFSLIIRKKIIAKQIVCWRLGHFLGNTDFFLNIQKKYKFDKYLFLWFYPCPSCNSVLESKINEKINVIPKFIGLPLNHLTNIFFSKIIDSDRDLFNLLDTTEPNLSFTPKEESEGLAFLKSLGIKANDKFVCLNVRDNAYLDFQSTNAGARVDWSYHDYRNCDIKNYKKAAITLANLGYYVFRMGVKVNESFDVDHPKIFDYATNNMRSEFLDVYLGAKCSFAISNGTGFDAIPYVFRRFILYVDHVPLNIINTFSKRFLLTTKKIWSKKLKRFLTFEEIIENNMHKNDFFLNKDNLNKIKLVESTAEEINKYVIEMHERMNGIREESKEDKERQKLFWQIFEKNPALHGDINAHFSSVFLKENKALLE
jgi:putative glycosyltransferase (TIGR04372 family)